MAAEQLEFGVGVRHAAPPVVFAPGRRTSWRGSRTVERSGPAGYNWRLWLELWLQLHDDDTSRRACRVWTGPATAPAITKTVVRKDFAAALAFVNQVGELAEARNHHPDIAISWNQVTLTLSTHSAGGLTQLDLDLAAAIDALDGSGPPARSIAGSARPAVAVDPLDT